MTRIIVNKYIPLNVQSTETISCFFQICAEFHELKRNISRFFQTLKILFSNYWKLQLMVSALEKNSCLSHHHFYFMSPTIIFGCFHSHSVSSQSMQVLSPGGDSSCSWVLVRALGHNLDERRDFTFTSPAWGVQSDREYTRLHN